MNISHKNAVLKMVADAYYTKAEELYEFGNETIYCHRIWMFSYRIQALRCIGASFTDELDAWEDAHQQLQKDMQRLLEGEDVDF